MPIQLAIGLLILLLMFIVKCSVCAAMCALPRHRYYRSLLLFLSHDHLIIPSPFYHTVLVV